MYGEMTVAGYLKFAAKLKLVSAGDLNERIRWAQEKCGLKQVEGKIISTLSKGFRQRVGIAQALLSKPEMLILDEPTIGLDPKQIREIRNLIKGLAGQQTIILSTHILPEVSMICDRVIVIHNGKMVLDASLEDLTKKRTLEDIFIDLISREEGNGNA